MRPSRSLHSLLVPLAILSFHAPAKAGVGVSLSISVGVPPPPLPVYAQPACPDGGYLWTPGYWAYGPDGWFWVPGAWVLPPEPGFLWTPGYWGWSDGVYLFHAGYWGPHVGFYGGINYGCGYGGSGYQGGYWRGDRFYYNRAVNNVTNARVTNVYMRNVDRGPATRVSFNGGAGGIAARPTQEERNIGSERHAEPTAAQRRHVDAAGQDRQLLASVNRGRPPARGGAPSMSPTRGREEDSPRADRPVFRGAPERPMRENPAQRPHPEPQQAFRPTQRPERQAPQTRERPPREREDRGHEDHGR